MEINHFTRYTDQYTGTYNPNVALSFRSITINPMKYWTCGTRSWCLALDDVLLGHKRLQTAETLIGGPVWPGKDISAAFWENWESHGQRSLL